MNFGTNVPILCMSFKNLLNMIDKQFCCEAQLFFFYIIQYGEVVS